MSEFGKIGVVGLMVEWAFIFYNSYRVLRRGPHGRFLNVISDFLENLVF